MNEAPLIGGLALLLAGVMAWRAWRALRTGQVTLYRRRASRTELGEARFWFALAVQFALAVLLLVVATDVLLKFGIRPA